MQERWNPILPSTRNLFIILTVIQSLINILGSTWFATEELTLISQSWNSSSPLPPLGTLFSPIYYQAHPGNWWQQNVIVLQVLPPTPTIFCKRILSCIIGAVVWWTLPLTSCWGMARLLQILPQDLPQPIWRNAPNGALCYSSILMFCDDLKQAIYSHPLGYHLILITRVLFLTFM